MKTLFYNPSQIITVNTNGQNFKRKTDMQNIGILTDKSILVENGIIKEFIATSKISKSEYNNIIDLTDKIILPGLVECHTHTVFSGSRSEEFLMKLNGKTYEEIAKAGGGINSTVKSVRESDFENLLEAAKPKVKKFIEQGVTTLEIKSGYGLSFYDEIKLLEVINELNRLFEIDIIPTFLGAHTFPPEYLNDKEKYIEIITKEMLPFIAEKNLASACDGFCEKTAFSPKQIASIFDAAKNLGFSLKLHTDQFNSIGGLDLALDYNSMSVDHLEVLGEEDTKKFNDVETVAVLLPGVSFSLKYNYAPARDLIDNNAIVALATDFNPGSSHINNISFIWALAAFHLKMTLEEIISAYTINSAKALKIADKVGSIEVGKNADFSVYSIRNYSDLLYHLSNNLNTMTIKKGKIIHENLA
ncbi:MAG: imidazolonepropionase [Ignavibacteriae bacterium]|nr:MAG: imidazolonepropionase [Ignavibacteriota bacterium]